MERWAETKPLFSPGLFLWAEAVWVWVGVARKWSNFSKISLDYKNENLLIPFSDSLLRRHRSFAAQKEKGEPHSPGRWKTQAILWAGQEAGPCVGVEGERWESWEW